MTAIGSDVLCRVTDMLREQHSLVLVGGNDTVRSMLADVAALGAGRHCFAFEARRCVTVGDADSSFAKLLDAASEHQSTLDQMVVRLDQPLAYGPGVLEHLVTRLMLLGDLRPTILVAIDGPDQAVVDELDTSTAFGTFVADLPRVHVRSS